MDSSYSRWSLVAILIVPLTFLLAFWLYSTAETLPQQISAYLLAAAFFLVALGMLVEILLADLVYWGAESAFENVTPLFDSYDEAVTKANTISVAQSVAIVQRRMIPLRLRISRK